jgi:hypothetical protein
MMSLTFSWYVYLLTVLASFLGLVVGAHYIDIATSVEKFSPYFKIPTRKMMSVGLASVFAGVLVGIYLTVYTFRPLFIVFVLIEGVAAIFYPREVTRVFHSYPAFGLSWGAIPFLACYYIQAGKLTPLIVSVAFFVGISVVMMHHLAIMTRESSDWRNAIYLLNMYKYSVYGLALVSVIGRLLLA